ncbi:unnamed protein product [Cuscuta campestris]|uniref:Uncharacterized protein n=1 Tax=Cuscuta campestris TaxID=132261 RepID=A0A484KA95_9ASTE|nr:unnamed protein product [Cuscuta campestris]
MQPATRKHASSSLTPMLTAGDSQGTLPSQFEDPRRGVPHLDREGSQKHPILAGWISIAVTFNLSSSSLFLLPSPISPSAATAASTAASTAAVVAESSRSRAVKKEKNSRWAREVRL